MTDYSQNTTFADKDALSSGDPNKVIKGSDVDAEFSEIQTAIATKIDLPGSPTANDALVWNGSAWAANSNLTWRKIAGDAGASGASLNLDSLTSSYRAYVLVFDELIPATDGATLNIRISTSAAYNSGASDYAWEAHTVNAGSVASTNDAADSEITITASNGLGSAAGETCSGVIWLFNPGDTNSRTRVYAHVQYEAANGSETIVQAGGVYLTAETNDGMQVIMSSGNISNINYTWHGLLA